MTQLITLHGTRGRVLAQNEEFFTASLTVLWGKVLGSNTEHTGRATARSPWPGRTDWEEPDGVTSPPQGPQVGGTENVCIGLSLGSRESGSGWGHLCAYLPL